MLISIVGGERVRSVAVRLRLRDRTERHGTIGNERKGGGNEGGRGREIMRRGTGTGTGNEKASKERDGNKGTDAKALGL